MENNSPIRLFCQYTANGISHKGRLTLLYLDANASGQLHHFILVLKFSKIWKIQKPTKRRS